MSHSLGSVSEIHLHHQCQWVCPWRASTEFGSECMYLSLVVCLCQQPFQSLEFEGQGLRVWYFFASIMLELMEVLKARLH